MGRHHAQLHLGHHGQSQGRRLPPPRRGAHVLREHARDRHGAASRLPVDAAHVPLQRLVLPLVAVGRCRHARVLAVGARQGDVRRHRRSRRHAPLRRAHRHVDAAQRQRRRAARPGPPRRDQSCRRPAAAGGARRDDGCRLPPHAPLRAHRDLRPGGRQRMEQRVARPRARRSARSSARARACVTSRSRT